MFRPRSDPAAPLVFLHIPKTAGTSLSRALGELRPWRHVLSDGGNISAELLRTYRELAPAERRSCLVHGHAFHDTMDAFADAVTLTVIRRPDEHAVSNYLHVRRDPAVPLHAEALALPFDAFMRRNWQFLVFQSISLDVPVSDRPIDSRELFFAHLPRIFGLLASIDLVGTTDDLQSLVDATARRFKVTPPAISRLNRAAEFGIAPDELATLRHRYAAFACDADLAPLVAVERLLYDTARRRAAA